MKKLFLFLTLGTILTTACTKREHDKEDENSNSTPITLTSKVDLKTKSTLQDTQINANQEVGFFVKKGETIVYDNNKLTADGAGKFTYLNKMYYPIEPGTVDFYAVHPYTTTATGLATINFSVNGDQTSEKNFLNSDLLYVKKAGVSKTNEAVPLVFDHKLSKVTFKIKKGDGISLAELSRLEILNILPETTLDLVSGSISAASGTKTNISVYGVTGSSDAEVSGMGAIIVPQTIAAGTKLFRIVINGEEFFYTTPTDISFTNATKYHYVLTISNTGIEVSSSIANWTESPEISGDGILIFS